MEVVGNIAGPLLAYEVLTAFFLEATFLGIMLFGFRRVPGWLHTLATVLVAVGTTLSAFWILVLNSWMQTPAGFEMIANDDGMLQAHATDWMAIIFNPSMPYRMIHMLLASGLTAAFVVAGISAFRWMIKDRAPAVMVALKTGVYTAAVLIPLQIYVGDLHGLNTYEYQPQKVAAMEGLWETTEGAPLVLFAIPDEEERTNHFALEIPKLTSWFLTHDFDGEVKGLNEFEGDYPPVAPVFWGFRIMVGVGILMLIVSWASAWVLWRRQDITPFWAGSLVGMTFSGWLAVLAGWYVTEIGRQPWLVFGVLKTYDALAPISAPMVGTTLAAYLIVYVLLIFAYVGTIIYMARKAGKESGKGPKQYGQPEIEGRWRPSAAE